MITRCSSNFFQAYTSFQKCKPSISYTGPCIWNNIPIEIKGIDILNNPDSDTHSSYSKVNSKPFILKFKNKMKKFVLSDISFI